MSKCHIQMKMAGKVPDFPTPLMINLHKIKQGNPDVPTDPASTAITAILFLRICFFCYAVSTKFFTALKKPILFLRCFYYIAAPAKFLPLLLFQQCQSNSKSDVENL